MISPTRGSDSEQSLVRVGGMTFPMPVTFVDQSNTAIQTLVDLCWTSLTNTSGGILFTPPLDTLTQAASIPDDDYVEQDDDLLPTIAPPIHAYYFTPAKRLINDFIIAVDSGIVHLGQLAGGGVAFAIRGAATCYAGAEHLILRYNTSALLLTPHNKLTVFRYIGERLGSPDLYVRDHAGTLIAKPSAIDTVNQMQDRCRSFVERMIQEEALGLLAANKGGLLLIDGSLVTSFDTPATYLRAMLQSARDHVIDVCAISKRSRITIGGLPIDSLFDPYPTFVGYAPLLKALEQERLAYEHLNMRPPGDITQGTEVFAARFGFGPPGVTFRVDVSKCWGSDNDDVINDVYSKCQLYGGYPKALIDAHQYSAFLGSDKLLLLADLVVRTGLTVKEQPSLGVLFQPFGAFGK